MDAAARKLILGSRGSELARTQSRLVTEALVGAWPGIEVATEIISTRGDQRTAEVLDPRAGRKGLFTGEIERALAAGEVDVAVHSAKDLPSEMASDLEIAAVLRRAPVEDVMIMRGEAQTPLDERAVIATGSIRRQYQLRCKFLGLRTVDLRGNVPTRLRKFVQSDWTAIVLARAGLERLGFGRTQEFDFEGTPLRIEFLPVEEFLPAGGQGIIALQIRRDDSHTKEIVRAISDRGGFFCLEAEREFLRLLHGDCGSPVGVLATIDDDRMIMRAQVFTPPTIEPRIARVEGNAKSGKKLAAQLWETING
jgi:hydroxymethylbilane synthase